MITLGQYLQPSIRHLPIDRFPEPKIFADWDGTARELGFRAVASGPWLGQAIEPAYSGRRQWVVSLLSREVQLVLR